MAAENVLATQATIGMLSAGFLQVLKKTKWVTAINDNSGTLNHLVLMVTSAFGALGIHLAWSASAHALTITGLDLATVGVSLWLWAKQWTIQYLVHRGAFGAVALPAPAKP